MSYQAGQNSYPNTFSIKLRIRNVNGVWRFMSYYVNTECIF